MSSSMEKRTMIRTIISWMYEVFQSLFILCFCRKLLTYEQYHDYEAILSMRISLKKSVVTDCQILWILGYLCQILFLGAFYQFCFPVVLSLKFIEYCMLLFLLSFYNTAL